MKTSRGFFVHVGLLALSVLAAILVWTRDKQPKALAVGDVVVWPSKGDVERVLFEGKTKTVTLEAKKDATGRYFVATVDKQTPPPKALDPDAGAPAEPPKEARSKISFVSVGAATKLADSLSPLKALRALGRIADDRAAEFGLDAPDGTLTVTVGGAERKMVFGAATPGGGDRYAKDPTNGEVYAIKGDVFRNLDTAESSMMERDVHEWKEAEVAQATITAGGKTRELVRGGPEGKQFWADPSTPDSNDETIGNWMSKLDRLRPTEYVDLPKDAVQSVVRVEYASRGKKLGYVDIGKGPADASGKAPYVITSEQLRLFAKVSPQLAEQVEQDVASIVK